MKDMTLIALFGAAGLAMLSACAPAPAPQPQVIYTDPTFDKLGNPSCRPGNVPVGGLYSADLPLCGVISDTPVTLDAP